jgi:hypothetical protein
MFSLYLIFKALFVSTENVFIICRSLFQRKMKVKPKIFVFDRKIAKEEEENGLRKNFP